MQKEELRLLAKQMCGNLLDLIDSNDNLAKESVINYLYESANILAETNNTPTSLNSAKINFENAFKDIAKQSIEFYSDTNERIEELATKHQQALTECKHEQIDLPTITEKFHEIQEHMSEEVRKANQIISTLSKKVKELETKSSLDPLTRVYNRRTLTEHLENICSKKITTTDLHLLILDIDNFKGINDRYGHVAGDKILIFIANIMRKTLRDGDKIFRYGGEEFIIILNRIDNEECQLITTRLLKIVRENKLIYMGENLHVTISIGATRLLDSDTPDVLIARADKALYRAKESGKDRMYSEI